MATYNEPGTVYPPSPVVEHPVRHWSQQDLDEFRAGWNSLDEQRKAFSRAQPVLYAETPEGLLNIRTAEIVEAAAPVPAPEPIPDPKEVEVRTAARTKKTRG